jgi:5-methylcytosine-specific restriction endonuclease McrA
MKTCSKCKISKQLDQFSKLEKAFDGLQQRCKQCCNEYSKTRYEIKKTEILAKCAEYYKNKDSKAAYIARRQYYEEYYQKNKERINKRNTDYAKNNREVRRGIKSRYRSQLIRGMSRLDRKKSTLHRKIIKNKACFYCKSYTKQMHDDHYYPLAKGGTDHWFNIVRACQVCNQKKNARLASSFF